MAKNARDAVVVAYGRSPLGRANKGFFSKMHPVEYAGLTLKGVIDKLPGFDKSLIEDVIVGCAYPQDYTGQNVARQIALRAGLPDSVPGMTVNRFCSSGLQTIATAANAIMAGQMDIVAAGGVERMTGMNMNPDETFFDRELMKIEPDIYMPMGFTAENVAADYNISREDMDALAVRSHERAAAAREAGKFKEEIIPIEFEGKVYDYDEGIRPGTTMESLAGLKPCFKKDGVVTAAISSQMTDGTGFVILMARETAEKLGYKPIAKFLGWKVAGVPARIMGIGPIAAVPKVMELTGLTLDQMDCIEINEAFASQSLACIRELGMNMDKVNPNGGAMALGHPLGATGAVLSCKILSELKRTGGKYGLVTMCIGGGMGGAGIYEMED